MSKELKLMLGDNILSLKKLPDNSIDSIVSDPPYGLSFMGKKWDYDVPSVEFWKEVYRVLKPGGHILSFGGTRTYHRMVVNIEDAGFEIRDQIMWLYGSGFPKSHNIGKAVDKLQGNEREVVGEQTNLAKGSNLTMKGSGSWQDGSPDSIPITKGQSPYEGWGTALKPANEPICVARKPLSEKSVAENVLKWGTGGINVDGCRVGNESIDTIHNPKITGKMGQAHGEQKGFIEGENTIHEGRFPANIILECLCDEVIKGEKGEPKIGKPGGKTFGGGDMSPEVIGKWFNDKGDIHTNPMCPCLLLDEQSGVSGSGSFKKSGGRDRSKHDYNSVGDFGSKEGGILAPDNYGDKGGASRFFYQAKVSKAERNMGLDGFEEKYKDTKFGTIGNRKEEDVVSKNNHPTVKPVALMAYLVRLITPPNGIVLDPFMGSGSTGIAARLEGFKFCGMEMDNDYFKIAEARIENFEDYRKFIKK